MLTKTFIGLLIAVVLGLSSFVAYDRWPSGESWGEGSPRYPIGGTVTVVAQRPSCPPGVLSVLKASCLRNGGEACQAYADCSH